MQKYVAALTIAAFLASGVTALAGQQTASVSISANVAQSCTTLNSSSGTIAFGTYDPFANASTPLDDNTGVTFTTHCSAGASNVYYSVDGGSNCTNSPVSGDRALKNGSNYLAYQLYEDSAHSKPWVIDSTCAGTTQLSSGTITSSTQDLTFSVFGRIPAGQDPAVGNGYTDTVTVAVNY